MKARPTNFLSGASQELGSFRDAVWAPAFREWVSGVAFGIGAAGGSEVRLRGHDERLTWRHSGDDLVVQLPAPLPDHPAHVLRVASIHTGEP